MVDSAHSESSNADNAFNKSVMSPVSLPSIHLEDSLLKPIFDEIGLMRDRDQFDALSGLGRARRWHDWRYHSNGPQLVIKVQLLSGPTEPSCANRLGYRTVTELS